MSGLPVDLALVRRLHRHNLDLRQRVRDLERHMMQAVVCDPGPFERVGTKLGRWLDGWLVCLRDAGQLEFDWLLRDPPPRQRSVG